MQQFANVVLSEKLNFSELLYSLKKEQFIVTNLLLSTTTYILSCLTFEFLTKTVD